MAKTKSKKLRQRSKAVTSSASGAQTSSLSAQSSTEQVRKIVQVEDSSEMQVVVLNWVCLSI